VASFLAFAVLATVSVVLATAALFTAYRWRQERVPALSLESRTGQDDVVSFAGIGDIHFGDAAGDLTSRHGLFADPAACTRRFTDLAAADPVLADGRLVLLWAHAPLHTPEGIAEGSTVTAVRAAYAGEIELTPPAGSHAYPGILVVRDDKAYLFLHDGQAVRKEIAGYADYVRRLYSEGFGAC
jgi:hypothetical protein